jgi:pilus assembly protein CpaB
MATQQQSQLSPRVRKLLSTRRGIITVAAGAAVLGGAILIVFLSAYRDSLTGADGTEKVLVANTLINPGSPADAIAQDQMYEITSVEKTDIDAAAVRDPDAIKGKVTTTPIYPGEQLTTTDFRAQNGSLSDQIRGRERAISIPFTTYRGLVGDLKAGDHVDVVGLFNLAAPNTSGGRPIARILMQDALVLKVPPMEDGVATQDEPSVVLRGSDLDATKLAYTSENGVLWLTLRPAAGAEQARKPSPIWIREALFGLPPISLNEFQRRFAGPYR